MTEGFPCRPLDRVPSSRDGIFLCPSGCDHTAGEAVAPHQLFRHHDFPTASPAEAWEGRPEQEMGKGTQRVWRRWEGLH